MEEPPPQHRDLTWTSPQWGLAVTFRVLLDPEEVALPGVSPESPRCPQGAACGGHSPGDEVGGGLHLSGPGALTLGSSSLTWIIPDGGPPAVRHFGECLLRDY